MTKNGAIFFLRFDWTVLIIYCYKTMQLHWDVAGYRRYVFPLKSYEECGAVKSQLNLNSTQHFRHRGHRATGHHRMFLTDQNVSIKNKTTAGVPQCCRRFGLRQLRGSYGYMETRLYGSSITHYSSHSTHHTSHITYRTLAYYVIILNCTWHTAHSASYIALHLKHTVKYTHIIRAWCTAHITSRSDYKKHILTTSYSSHVHIMAGSSNSPN